MGTPISMSSFEFLEKLKQNNFREWMQENKKEYLANEKDLKHFILKYLQDSMLPMK